MTFVVYFTWNWAGQLASNKNSMIIRIFRLLNICLRFLMQYSNYRNSLHSLPNSVLRKDYRVFKYLLKTWLSLSIAHISHIFFHFSFFLISWYSKGFTSWNGVLLWVWIVHEYTGYLINDYYSDKQQHYCGRHI